MDANYWKETLGLQKHPEGGYFREVYRSDESVIKSALPKRFSGKRCLSTAIYYMLEGREVSRFHRIKQDEIWHFYEGHPVLIYAIAKRKLTVFRLGRNPQKGQLPMVVIPKGTIFAAELENHSHYALLGCTVSPGFEFDDFEIMPRASLMQKYPEHHDLILRFTE